MSATAASASSSAAKKGRKASASTASAAPVAAAPAPAPVAAPVPAPVAASAPAVTESTAAPADSVNVVSEFNSLVEQVNTLRSTLSTVFSSMKKLEKAIPRELKRAQKGRRRKASATEGGADKPKKETVFTKPTPISDALCTFLGVSKGTPLSRSEVTTRVCKYAKDHNLMNKQVIKADAALRKLLNLTEKDELKILNLQRYLKPHYIKPAASA
jgi:chromatin remodeling complex protein RSC6